MVFSALETDRGKHPISPFAELLTGEVMSSVEQRQLNIFTRRSPRQEIKVLENKADFVAAHTRQIIVGKAAEIFAVNPDLSGGRPV